MHETNLYEIANIVRANEQSFRITDIAQKARLIQEYAHGGSEVVIIDRNYRIYHLLVLLELSFPNRVHVDSTASGTETRKTYSTLYVEI